MKCVLVRHINQRLIALGYKINTIYSDALSVDTQTRTNAAEICFVHFGAH